MLRLRWLAPFRCELCRHRFVGHGDAQPEILAGIDRGPRGRSGRLAAATDNLRPVLIVGALACVLTLGLLVLWALAGAFDFGGVLADMFAWLLPAVTKPTAG